MKIHPVLLGLLGLATLLAPATATRAQEWPAKTIRIVVAYPAGGPSDAISRTIAQRLSEAWKQAVIVENKPGASGMIAADIVAKAAPDGYTLLVVNQLLVQTPSLYKSVPYQPLRDLTPITDLISSPLWLAVNSANTKARTLKEFIDQTRAQGGNHYYASVGTGSIGHLYGFRLSEATGIPFTHVPYKGAAPVVMAILSGEVTASFVDYATLKPHLESGKVRALAVSDTKRTLSTPDVPTFTESGYKGFEASSWIGLFTTAKTPPEIVRKLNAEVARILKQPDVIAKFQDGQGFQMGGLPQAQWATQVADDYERWGVLIKKAGVTLD
ncbi:MAG: tripartite tricarboxylate transporter substrate binding protein [Burkholderiaceae bacterium]